MSGSRSGPLRLVAVAALLVIAATLAYHWWPAGRDWEPDVALYEKYISAFEVGVAALDADVPEVAEENLSEAIKLIPQEPAGWANRCLLMLRYNRMDEAESDLAEARRLAPDDPSVEKLLGLLDQKRGQYSSAIAHLRRAADINPRDVETLHHLAHVIDQQHEPGSEIAYLKLLDAILQIQPDNLFVLTNRLRVAYDQGDEATTDATIQELERLSEHWGKETLAAFAALKSAVAAHEPSARSRRVAFSNLLRAEPAFRASSAAVSSADVVSIASIKSPLVLRSRTSPPSAADVGLDLAVDRVAGAPPGQFNAVSVAWLKREQAPTVLLANSKDLICAGGDKPIASVEGPPAEILPVDWNNDFRTDLVVVGSAGLSLFVQGEDGSFQDVTESTGLTEEVRRGRHVGAWAIDFDLDGDLDVMVAAESAPPLLLRNNSDGKLLARSVLHEVKGAASMAWGDLNHDGAGDIAIVDEAGALHVFVNRRMGEYAPWPSPPVDLCLAVTIADVDRDGSFDLVAVRRDGSVVRMWGPGEGHPWSAKQLFVDEAITKDAAPGGARLLIGDLDNNGIPDLVVAGPSAASIWLAETEPDRYVKLGDDSQPGHYLAMAGLRSDGRLSIVGLDQDGRPVQINSSGGKAYHWQDVHPVAKEVKGDQRINSFALGGQVEVRAGTFVAKQWISAPVLHFGLGERLQSDVIRLQWPNGTWQAEYRPQIDQQVTAEQRLKGSCPFLYSWDGAKFAFVTDFMWSTPLGMYISAQNRGDFVQTTDWVMVRGQQLVPRDGLYELRVGANLWETHYFDQLSLMVVDHPAAVHVAVDERFFMEPTEPTVYALEEPRPVARALDQHGEDVSVTVAKRDGVCLDHFALGEYQGIAEDHWVEVELPEDAPSEGPVYLLASGWVHPTDSSINFAIEQGRHARPASLSIEVPNGAGGWKVARDQLGFPAGKNKTIVLRLDGLDGPGTPRRFRLCTNMEIYWDALEVAAGRGDAQMLCQRLTAQSAVLRYRGIVSMRPADHGAPELPIYDRLAARGQYWRDLVGWHTRFGEVSELIEQVDDRYVIANAGDEIVLKFAAPESPPEGWKRDFIWISDGWVKDGDFNTRFGDTVLPLPWHGMRSYTTPPTNLENDPVYRRHARDWEVYHTRFVTPDGYEMGLRGFHAPPANLPWSQWP